MNGVNKLIGFAETAMSSMDGSRYSIFEDEQGRAIFLDHQFRIRVAISVTSIQVTQYSVESGSVLREVTVPWDGLTLRQKQRIIDLLETNDELEEEIENTLGEIFKG